MKFKKDFLKIKNPETGEWEAIPAIQGEKGADGKDGKDGLTTSIKINGETYIQDNGIIELPDIKGNCKVAYGTCSTEAATAEKTVVVDDTNWKLEVGSMVAIRFSVSNKASNVTINVNDTGAYPIWASAAEYTSTSTTYTGYANRTYTYMFNGTHWIWMSSGVYPSATTNASLGHGYGVCSTAEATLAKACTISSYTLSTGGSVSVKFTNAVPANSTLNIRTRGAKKIFYKGVAITDGIIKAGDTATFVYDGTQYQLISIDSPSSTKKGTEVFFISGDTEASTQGHWVGQHPDITELYEGLVIAYQIPIAGGTSNTYIKINDFDETIIYFNRATAMKEQYLPGSTIFLVYTNYNNKLTFRVADYNSDTNTRNTIGDYQSTDTKLYLAGSKTIDTSDDASYATSFVNPNVYIGTDNALYSENKKVATEEHVDSEIGTLEQYVKDEIARVENAGDIVNSVEEMTNTNKQYVLSSTNTWWQYKSETVPAGGVLPNVNNAIKWDTCTVYLNQRYNSSTTLVDAPGCATFEFIADDAMLELIANVNPVWVRFKGCSIYSTQGNTTSLKVVGWTKSGAVCNGWVPSSQVLAYVEDKDGINNEPIGATVYLNDNTKAPVYAIKLGYYNKTVSDNSTNQILSRYSDGDISKIAFSVAVNFANTNAITEADLENVYITFNEPIVSYEEQTISDWYDTGIEYNPNGDNEVAELQTKVTNMETKVDEIENRVETLESKSSTSGGTSSEVSTLPDYWISRLNDIGDKIDTLQKENGMDTLQFLWCSDIHGVPGTSPSNTTYIGEIGRYMMDKYNIPFFMVTGDIMSQASHSSTAKIWAEYDKLIPMLSPINNEEFLAIKGNHDGAWGSPMEYNGQTNQYYHSYIGDKALFNAFMRRQTLDRYKRVFGKDGMYFYIDYHNYRIYMLNSHTFGDNSVNEQGQAVYNGFKQDVFGSEQLQWIADTLMTVEENQKVIFTSHAPINYMADMYVFANMLIAYRNRTNYTNTTDVSGTFWASGTEYSTSTVTKDFTDAKGDFVGHFNGHIHIDKIEMFGNIPTFAITCAGGDVRDSYYTDGTLTRTKETATETAIDLVTVTSEYIYFTRIGSGYDRKFNRTTNEITIDYDSAFEILNQGDITSEVIWNENTRLSSDGGYSEQYGVLSSSDILVEKGDVIRIYGMSEFKYYSNLRSYNKNDEVLSTLDIDFDYASSGITGNTTANTDVTVSIDDNKVLTITILNDEVYYIRVSNYVGDNIPTDIRVSRNLELDYDTPETDTPETDTPVSEEITDQVTWTADTRLSSSGGYSSQGGIYASNDISVENGDIIRIYGATTWKYYGYVNGYSASGFLVNMDASTETGISLTNNYYTVVVDENMVMTITITHSDVSYIRVCGSGLGNDSVRVSRNLELS